MILVTIGTNEQPFDRLVRAAGRLGGEEPLFVQYGASQVSHGRGEWVDFLSFDDLMSRAREARVFVSHAGVGSIMLARRCGLRPVIVPRRHHLGEAVDDHQLPLARRLAAAGMATLVEDADQLEDVLHAPEPPAFDASVAGVAGARALSADVRQALTGLGVARRAPAPVRPYVVSAR